MSKKYINSEKHRKEHSKWDRRGFMKVLGLAGAGSISLGNTNLSSVKNGLAVVPVERGASAGSFFVIPPQVQLDIASRKKLITDEHSGRILVDKTLAEEEEKKMESIFSSI